MKQTPNESGVWGNVRAVEDIADAEYQIALKTVTTNPDHVKTLLFTREPPCLVPESRWASIDAYRKYPLSEIHLPQVWWVDKTYDELKSLEPMEKTRDLSWVITNKGQSTNPPWFRLFRWYREWLIEHDYRKYEYKYLPLTRRIIERGGLPSDFVFKFNNLFLNYPTDGHVIRMDFLDRLVDEYSGTMDLFGRGTWDSSKPYYRGELEDKWDGLESYRYSLAISNYRGDNYFGKVTEPLLAWCMPICWGCTNLPDFLPEDSYVWVDIEDEDAPDRIEEIVESNCRERNLDAIREARNRILDRYQFWPTVEREIEKLEGDASRYDEAKSC